MTTQTIFITAGSTSNSCDVSLVQNAASTAAGDPCLGLAYNTASLAAYYQINGTGTLTSTALATQTVTGAWSSGGFVKRSDANAPGQYRYDIPNAIVASPGYAAVTFSGAPAGTAGNMETHTVNIVCTAINLYDTVRMGLTALPNVVSGSAGALPTTGTGANQVNVSGGRADANVTYNAGAAVIPRYTGTALSGGGSTIGLANGTSTEQCGVGDLIVLTGGTGVGQSGIVNAPISGAGGATPAATMQQAWQSANPDNTTTYEIFKIGQLVPSQPSDVWAVATRTLTSAVNITSDGTNAARESTLATLATTVASVAASVWTQATRLLTGATNITSDGTAAARESTVATVQGLLPTALVGGRIKSDVGSVTGVVLQQNGSGTQNIGGP